MDNITKDTIQALKEGDHAAFEQVFLFYFNKVKSFINGFIKSGPDAESLAQEVFIKLWTNREEIDPGRNFNSHIYISARNATVNFLKERYSHDLPANGLAVADGASVSGDGNGFEVAREIDLLVDMALVKMPLQRKAVYELNHKERLSNAEIAGRLGISPKAVENHMKAVLKELKSVIESFVVLMN